MGAISMRSVVLVFTTMFLLGCASSSKEIRATYVSPMVYDGFSCDQLVAEVQRIQRRVSGAAGDVDDRASGDAVKMGVGLVLFWPTLFFIKGDGPEAQELARLKGEYEALEQTYNRKNCARQPQASSTSAANPPEKPQPSTSVSLPAPELSSTVSLRLESDGGEVIGRPCEVRVGSRFYEVLSGGLFVVPGDVRQPLQIECELVNGDRIEATINPGSDGRYPPIAVIKF